jgi:hypothetical protein
MTYSVQGEDIPAVVAGAMLQYLSGQAFSKLVMSRVQVNGIEAHYTTALYSAVSEKNKLAQVE